MCQKESWVAIFATTEAHSTQRDQPPRMHEPGLWMYEQKFTCLECNACENCQIADDLQDDRVHVDCRLNLLEPLSSRRLRLPNEIVRLTIERFCVSVFWSI